MNTDRPRLLTGDRPTHRLHLGHYAGSLRTRLELQDRAECFFLVADLHTLTTRPQPEAIAASRRFARDIVLDYLSVGIDPERAAIALQSAVQEVYELQLLLGMLVSAARLERIPSLKEMARNARLGALPFGLLGYPVLQAADILLPRATLVPVGKDNQAHVEVAREIARRFNRLYGEVFPLPRALLSRQPSLVGTDGRARMSKSLGNTIDLADPPEAVRAKVLRMVTDPQRVHADVPGRVRDNPVFVYHRAFNADADQVADLEARYRRGAVGDVEVKERLIEALNRFLDPIRARRRALETRPGLAEEVLHDGTARLRREAARTMAAVRQAMGLEGLTPGASAPQAADFAGAHSGAA